MAEIRMKTDEIKARLHELKAGDSVLLSGTIYTARDAAHKRIDALLNEGKEPPFDINGAVIYYAGPTPEREGTPIGSCGPTTSGRMDPYAPRLISLGLAGMIGKGERNDKVVEAMKEYGCLYFCAIGGAGALAAKCIKKVEVIAFPELGCESVKKMTVEDFPVILTIDAQGNNFYREGRAAYLQSVEAK